MTSHRPLLLEERRVSSDGAAAQPQGFSTFTAFSCSHPVMRHEWELMRKLQVNLISAALSSQVAKVGKLRPLVAEVRHFRKEN